MEPSKNESAGDAFAFGRFRLIPSRQLLLRDGVPVQLGSRALEILTALVRRRGELVSKDDLIAAVWPNMFVDESNLKVNVCHLRRSLGDTQKPPTYIATVAGRGYRFVAPLQIASSNHTSGSLTPLNYVIDGSFRIVPHESGSESRQTALTIRRGRDATVLHEPDAG